MTDLILHHYPMSPFSQKVRGMLGYAGLPWRSVVTRELPPRPHLDALAGGYRRIPVAQAGADVFCDSRLIGEEIALRAARPELALANLPDVQRQWVAHVDTDIFFACVLAGGNRKLGAKARASLSTTDLLRFAWDRLKVGVTASIPITSLRKARPVVLAHAEQVESMLTGDFLFGPTPTHADFATWHMLWFIRDLAASSLLRDFPKLNAWMDRMAAFGEGTPAAMTVDESLAVARAATPRPLTAAECAGDPLVGRAVTVAPADYWQEPARGTLVGATPQRLVLARDDARVGTVHVHFPRERFVVGEAKR